MAIMGNDTLTYSLIEQDTGQFYMNYLPLGVCNIFITDTLRHSTLKKDVLVQRNQITDIGSLTIN